MSAIKQQQLKPFCTIPETETILNLSRKTVERELALGGLVGVFRYGPGGGRIVRVTRESIERYYQPLESVATVNGCA